VFLQESKKLGVKSHFSVMRFLILDVFDRCAKKRMTYAKRAIALLPREFVALLICPSGRIRFYGLNSLGQRQARGDLDEKVNVIFDSTDGMDKDSEVLTNPCGVGPEARLKFIGEGFTAVLGAEDNVNQVLGVGV
jgi:hypothetical protein